MDGKTIRYIRQRLGLSVEKMAQHMGVKINDYIKLEEDNTFIDQEDLDQLLNYFSVFKNHNR